MAIRISYAPSLQKWLEALYKTFGLQILGALDEDAVSSCRLKIAGRSYASAQKRAGATGQ